MHGGSLGYTGGKVLGFGKCIKLGISGDKVLGNILGNMYGITLGIDIETWVVSINGSFDFSNDSKFEGLLLWDYLGYTGCKVIGSHEDTKPGLYYGKVIETILGNSDEIILALNVELELGFLDESFDGFYDGNFIAYCLETHWYLQMIKVLARN